MKLRIQNQLTMVGTCITIAYKDENQLVVDGQPPVAFGADLAVLATDYAAISATHALAMASTGGAGDAKSKAETALEDNAYAMARALANHFKKTGDLDRRGKVDFSKTDFVRLRNLELRDQATAIRDLALAATTEPGATDRGITPARIGALTAAITVFSKMLNTPRGQIVTRSTLLKEVETDTAALLEDLRDLDDLVVQFAATPAGQRFVQAWQKARVIVDAGHGPGTPEEEDPTPPAPTPPAP